METINQTEILKAEAAIQELVAEISRYSTHSREAEAAVNSMTGAIKELVASRESLDSFFQQTQDKLQKSIVTFISEAKNAAENLIRCVDQENKENNRLSQINNQLQELTEKLIDIIQGLNSAIEKNRLSLAERLQSLEKILTPFKDTIVKQEITLSQFGNDFTQLKINLSDVQQSLHSTIQNLEKLPNLHREILKNSVQYEQNQSLAIQSLQDAQSKAMKVSKWNMALTVFNFLILGGGLIFTFMNFKF